MYNDLRQESKRQQLILEGGRGKMKPIHKCIEPGCENEAGGLYSSYWCPDHDEERQKRHEKEFAEMRKLFPAQF